MSQMSKGRIICEDVLRPGRGLVSVTSTLTALSRYRNLFKRPQAAPHQAQTPVGSSVQFPHDITADNFLCWALRDKWLYSQYIAGTILTNYFLNIELI